MFSPLTPAKVLLAWPAAGSAAIQPLTTLLEGEVLEMVAHPELDVLDRACWPELSRKSCSRASDGAWASLVAAACQRGMARPAEEDQVFHGAGAEPVRAGAGGVEKIKVVGHTRHGLLRFIGIFCPINDYWVRAPRDDDKLPCVGQIAFLYLQEGEEILIGSEDFESCFKLFTLPDKRLGYFSYGKRVPGHVVGMPDREWVRPALRVVPMGWVSPVAVMQAVAREMAFGLAGTPRDAVVQKGRDLPDQSEVSILYFDSYDRLRVADEAAITALAGEDAPEHERCVQVRADLGLPLNASKSLMGATRASLQGGFLDSESGAFGLEPSKGCELAWIGLSLLSQKT
ncbi:unnamed protein product [Prorocentrum cordatum]|uniref:RNA-dependent RNA polymerase n=1 Tax=Prorocentrum cordatum TaxID=2364126 RepID=A0ABN9SZM8_9DINO|nr:unnamed protein product [Polarella glacialis]